MDCLSVQPHVWLLSRTYLEIGGVRVTYTYTASMGSSCRRIWPPTHFSMGLNILCRHFNHNSICAK
jgi:hypothetical protein